MAAARAERKHVIQAINEFDRLGLEGFYDRFGFWKSTRYDLIYRGRNYPPKGIYGRARQIADRNFSVDLHGGAHTNKPLQRLGFEVVDKKSLARPLALDVPDREADYLMTSYARKLVTA